MTRQLSLLKLSVFGLLAGFALIETTSAAQAITTSQQLGACKRAKKGSCWARQGSGGDWVIKTGSGRLKWCPPEKSGECVSLD